MAMTTWTKRKLEDIAEEKRIPYTPTKAEVLPYLGLEHIEQQTLKLSGVGSSAETGSQKKKFFIEDVLYGSLRPYFRKVYQPKFDGVCSTDITVLTAKNISRNDFLKYLIASKAFIDQASGAANGTKMPRAGWNAVRGFEFDIPDLPTQTRIASVLSAYDDLIENNEKRIKALEEMAQLLYTEWFVKFKFPGHEKVKMVDSGTEYGMVPEGWGVKRLGDRIQIQKGKNITLDTVNPGEVPVVAGGLSPAYFHDKANTKSPVVTISASGANAGFTRLYFEDVWASDCSFIDLSVTPHVYFYYLFLKNLKDDIFRLQRGSAQPHVYPKDLMGLMIVDAGELLIGEFNHRVSTLYKMIANMTEKNKSLSHIRDLLIPQLVTGKRELK